MLFTTRKALNDSAEFCRFVLWVYSRWTLKRKGWPWRGCEAWARLGGCERYTPDASCGIHPAVGQGVSREKEGEEEEEEEAE